MDTEVFVEALSRIFAQLNFPEIWIIDLLVRGRINVMATPPEKEAVIPVYESKEYEGSVRFGFPNEPQNLGSRFDEEQWRRHRCDPFIKLVSTLYLDGLKSFFSEFIRIMDREYAIATSTVGELRALVHKHSRWTVVVYFADLSNNPLIIMNESLAEIVDQQLNTKFRVECELVTVKARRRLRHRRNP
jgi:hypothetical protein